MTQAINKGKARPRKKAWRLYLLSAILTLFITGFVLKFYKVDQSIPYYYSRDSLWFLFMVKSLAIHEWSPPFMSQLDRLAAPFGFTHGDFCGWADGNLAFLMMKCYSFFIHDYAKLYNYHQILTFILPALTSLYVFRYYRIPNALAVVFSILYSFQPYHFIRLQGHGTVSTYCLLPLQTLILTWIWSKKPIFFKLENGKYQLDFRNYKAIFSIIVLSLAGMTLFYYSFFFCVLAAVAGLSALLYRKKVHHLIAAFILIAIITTASTMNLSPFLKYWVDNGVNEEAKVRSYVDEEIFGLKIVQMLLPVEGHRIPALAKLRQEYNKHPNINENSWAALGIIGSMGLLFLLVYLLSVGINSKTVYYKLGVLTLGAILFATIGGFSSFLSFLHTPFRCNNRISIFIAFFSLMALAFVLRRYQKRVPPGFAYLGLGALLVIGIYDQSPPYFKVTNDYEARKNEFLSDKEFVSQIENTAPKNASIFQLPFVAYPVGPSINNVDEWDHFRGYIHSSTLKWSFGPIVGRYPVIWYQSTAESPVDQMLYKLSIMGFSGIYIDRFGYKDNAAELEANLSRILDKAPLVSKNRRLSYFDMTSFKDKILKNIDKDTLEELRQPTQYEWGGEFSVNEKFQEKDWRWCGNKGRLRIINPSNKSRKERLYVEFYPVRPTFQVVIESEGFHDVVQVNKAIEKYEKIINLAPKSKVLVWFHTDEEPIYIPNENRTTAFSIYNYELKDLTSDTDHASTLQTHVIKLTTEDKPAMVSGWSSPETDHERTFTWSDGNPSVLRFPMRPKGVYELSFRALPVPREETSSPPQAITICLGGECTELELVDGEWRTYTSLLHSPDNLVDGHADLVFRYRFTRSPSAGGRQDTRALGAAFEYVKLTWLRPR